MENRVQTGVIQSENTHGHAILSRFDTNQLIFYVNGNRIEENRVDPRTTLAVYLRDRLQLKGTKIGCNEGGCGACTVMISDIDPITENVRHYSANACLTPVCAVFGKAVTTVEGIGGPNCVSKKLHPVQERLSKAHGSQCGYCTPGFIMAMYSLLRNHPQPTQAQIDDSIQGNLCRCTGYRPILEAFYSFIPTENGTAKIPNDSAAGGCCSGMPNGGCCKQQKSCPVSKTSDINNATAKSSSNKERSELLKLTTFDSCAPYDPTQELIFPPELKLHKIHNQSFALEDENGIRWLQPTKFDQLLALKKLFPHGRLISGNSELAIELKFRFIDLSVAINPKQVAELREVRMDENNGIYMGTGLSLTEMREILNTYIDKLPEWKSAVFRSVCAMLHYFAGKHVRNMASIAGNIATASPISDLNPILMASGASIVLESEERGERTVKIDEHFFLGYRRTSIRPDEVIKAVWIPFSKKTQLFRAYKQAQRREDDIAIVTGAFSVTFEDEAAKFRGNHENNKLNNELNHTHRIKDIRISYGGMAPVTKLALETVKGLEGRAWSNALVEDVTRRIAHEFHLPPGVPGGMSRYRQALAISFFYKFFIHVSEQLGLEIDGLNSDSEIESLIGEPQLLPFSSTQIFQDVPNEQKEHDPVGRPLMHQSGEKHTTGEAVYCTDTKVFGCLHMAYVMSPVAAGIINTLDVTKALEVNGVIGYVDKTDVPGQIMIGHGDTPVFADEQVFYYGQPIGAIIAEDHETARRAANLIKVDIITDAKPIVTIEDAIERSSFHFQKPFKLHSSLAKSGTTLAKRDDWETAYRKIVQGQIRIGGQEHFYLETQNCVAVPGEGGEIDIISSTQSVSDVQADVAKALGIARHKIRVIVKRIGGGFGGKESCCGLFAAGAAVAAIKFNRPIRCILERFDDMAISGTRHPFLFNYKMAVDDEGKFLDFDVQCYNNCGFTIDLSKGVMERCMVHIDNVYKFQNADITGTLCKTNTASNTAFRGFGGPQGMFAAETIIKHVAEEFGFDVDEIRERNFYQESDCTIFGMHLRQCNIGRCWKECRDTSNYDKRKKLIEEYNKKHKYRKHGSVLVSHAGMEMGQGLHTKILQIAARCLDIDISLVHIQETATDKVPNTSPTAASVGSDMNGLAVQDACEKLQERLEPFKKLNPDGQWKDWVMAAYVNRVSLSATGFAIIHSEPVDFMDGRGAELFGYCVYGVACSEVEVDCLTGDHHVLRTDIVMDIGDSLNPAVDIGQIEGAFIQGYGLFTMEEVKLRPDGTRLTRGPGNYKIPSADDAPRQFNVKLLKGSSNPRGIFSSKAVGEPPLFLGSSVLFAIREAVRAYRLQNGHNGYFRFDSPATPERIRMACLDHVVSQIPELPSKDKYVPWIVDL
ncbi:molybdopterin-binding domain of aldehyde dehydrogenase domain-containing protein [Ditylenchus destructor]|uniref:Molybdopterin-binding domain of aldehyde dehydrogenase domain-containing protein n=1 Tax=Ditylenchus destructor TaxID=166010 RepID=A0AAD4N5J5_9BILA|nr:molybdopterin-binding domain of aldehyde dehydrogenase domain-containing protein [Ditylenchus destructor]